MKLVYADYAATTPVEPGVSHRMSEISEQAFANPSSLHSFGRIAATVLDENRHKIAQFLGCEKEEVFFTGSGTESNNLAILGVAKANKNRGRKIVTTKVEHPSVLNACRALERDGFEIAYVNVLKNGQIDKDELLSEVDSEAILVTIHLGNSEIGVVQPIAELVKEARAKNPEILVHIDACQATAYIDLDVSRLGADLLTFNGSKVYGPRGIAVLFVRRGVNLFPIVYGGGQEKSLRSGTENTPAIAGLAKAVELVNTARDSARIGKIRDKLQLDLARIGCTINCADGLRLPNHLSVTLPHSRESDLVKAMDQRGIAVSAGSACSSKSLVDSHVLTAIGKTSEEINRTIRITLGRSTTEADCERILETIKSII